jgi:thiamine pyrophosphate-dependent acetolactate synthase large subunit-like protein
MHRKDEKFLINEIDKSFVSGEIISYEKNVEIKEKEAKMLEAQSKALKAKEEAKQAKKQAKAKTRQEEAKAHNEESKSWIEPLKIFCTIATTCVGLYATFLKTKK